MSSRRTDVTPLRRERLYESLAEHISSFIDAQGLGPGDRLPSERQLAADLGVSRATLSRALAALETRGVIQVRHGVGALVAPGAAHVGPAGDSETLPSLDLGGRPSGEIAQAREAVLAGIARAAASNPREALKAALLADDGRPRLFDDTWRCIKRLADSSLLTDLDDGLAAGAPPPPDSPTLRGRLALLADAILRSDPSAAAMACTGLLGRPAVRHDPHHPHHPLDPHHPQVDVDLNQ
ncbi:FadR/GntR family transcriptional regulator [Propionibacteriaceae bacterium G1746]|uniref:FadR/GntR family transcriptional regulator n=1 Tax=Aestuariimicrobium sp. G57 TaxID=3418485 RepID=UPI003C1321C8